LRFRGEHAALRQHIVSVGAGAPDLRPQLPHFVVEVVEHVPLQPQ
jgi:hypothetical protein